MPTKETWVTIGCPERVKKQFLKVKRRRGEPSREMADHRFVSVLLKAWEMAPQALKDRATD